MKEKIEKEKKERKEKCMEEINKVLDEYQCKVILGVSFSSDGKSHWIFDVIPE